MGGSTNPCWWATERREEVEQSKMLLRAGQQGRRSSLACLPRSRKSLRSPFARMDERGRGFVHGCDRIGMNQLACSQFTIHGIPKRSTTMPKPAAQNVCAKGITIMPSVARISKIRLPSAASFI
jgi:hypothetical protein